MIGGKNMKLVEPKSMEECIYFTNRAVGENFTGNARCWVLREKCPKCSSLLVQTKRGQIKCSDKDCGYIKEIEKNR